MRPAGARELFCSYTHVKSTPPFGRQEDVRGAKRGDVWGNLRKFLRLHLESYRGRTPGYCRGKWE